MIQFRPALWMTILLVPALGILCWLGAWQLQRLTWKNEWIAALAAGQSAPAQTLAQVLKRNDQAQESHAWARVTVRGEYDTDARVSRLYSILDGEPGYRYLALFFTEDNRSILVDRGFAPNGAAIEFPPSGMVQLQGFLHPAQSKGWMTPPTDHENNIWFWRDTERMNESLIDREAFIANYVLDLEVLDRPDQVWPRPVGAPPMPVNNHLDYALTWFGLAIGLIGVYLAWHLQHKRLRFRVRN